MNDDEFKTIVVNSLDDLCKRTTRIENTYFKQSKKYANPYILTALSSGTLSAIILGILQFIK